LPVVFVCENNLYGEYSRINLTTPVENIADRAASYAMPGVIADGQDVDTVAKAMETAVARARAGRGPTLVEMKTYRYSGHSRSDPATYRPAGELDAWLKRDPIDILADKLVSEGEVDAGKVDDLRKEMRETVEHATEEVLAAPNPDIAELLSHVDARGPGDDRRVSFWTDRAGRHAVGS
jgi:acetoin:2,6-dichlorophenolindophenol oxidoreductase subunit alpha